MRADVTATFDDRLTSDEFFANPYPTYDVMREQAKSTQAIDS